MACNRGRNLFQAKHIVVFDKKYVKYAYYISISMLHCCHDPRDEKFQLHLLYQNLLVMFQIEIPSLLNCLLGAFKDICIRKETSSN